MNLKKKTQLLNFTKIRPVGAELFHADGQTDMTKLRVFSANLRTRPKTKCMGKNIDLQPTNVWCINDSFSSISERRSLSTYRNHL